VPGRHALGEVCRGENGPLDNNKSPVNDRADKESVALKKYRSFEEFLLAEPELKAWCEGDRETGLLIWECPNCRHGLN
jgi:hypothetical protein